MKPATESVKSSDFHQIYIYSITARVSKPQIEFDGIGMGTGTEVTRSTTLFCACHIGHWSYPFRRTSEISIDRVKRDSSCSCQGQWQCQCQCQWSIIVMWNFWMHSMPVIIDGLQALRDPPVHKWLHRICIEIHVSVSEKCSICCCCHCRHCCDDWLNFHRQMSQLSIVVMTRQRCPLFPPLIPFHMPPEPLTLIIRQGQKQIVKLFVNFIVHCCSCCCCCCGRSYCCPLYIQLISESAHVPVSALFVSIFGISYAATADSPWGQILLANCICIVKNATASN